MIYDYKTRLTNEIQFHHYERCGDPSTIGNDIVCRMFGFGHPHGLGIIDKGIVSMLKSLFMATGANGLLNIMDDEKDWINFSYLAESISYIELDLGDLKEIQKIDQYSRQLSDLRSNGKRGLMIFFAKRMTCNCLMEKYEEAKRQHPVKMEECFFCPQIIEFKSLMVCARCKVAQYCRTECQHTDWPKHEVFCVKKPK